VKEEPCLKKFAYQTTESDAPIEESQSLSQQSVVTEIPSSQQSIVDEIPSSQQSIVDEIPSSQQSVAEIPSSQLSAVVETPSRRRGTRINYADLASGSTPKKASATPRRGRQASSDIETSEVLPIRVRSRKIVEPQIVEAEAELEVVVEASGSIVAEPEEVAPEKPEIVQQTGKQ